MTQPKGTHPAALGGMMLAFLVIIRIALSLFGVGHPLVLPFVIPGAAFVLGLFMGRKMGRRYPAVYRWWATGWYSLFVLGVAVLPALMDFIIDGKPLLGGPGTVKLLRGLALMLIIANWPLAWLASWAGEGLGSTMPKPDPY